MERLAVAVVDVVVGCDDAVDAPPKFNDGNVGAVVAVCDAEVEAAEGAKDGKGDAAGAELAGCEVEVEVDGKLNAGAAVALDALLVAEAG